MGDAFEIDPDIRLARTLPARVYSDPEIYRGIGTLDQVREHIVRVRRRPASPTSASAERTSRSSQRPLGTYLGPSASSLAL